MPADTTIAQQVPPDEAAAIRDLTDHVALLAREHVEMLDRAAALETAVAKLVEAGAMRPAPPPEGLAELEAHLVAEGETPRFWSGPAVGTVVLFHPGIGKGWCEATVVGVEPDGTLLLDEHGITWRRGPLQVAVRP